jgi:hypothetical protein
LISLLDVYSGARHDEYTKPSLDVSHSHGSQLLGFVACDKSACVIVLPSSKSKRKKYVFDSRPHPLQTHLVHTANSKCTLQVLAIDAMGVHDEAVTGRQEEEWTAAVACCSCY